MTIAIIELLYQGAKSRWPDIQHNQFEEAGKAVVGRMEPDTSASISEIANLLEEELVKRMGPGIVKPKTENKSQLITLGTKVRTTRSNTPDSEWGEEAKQSRRWGVEGRVSSEHGSHGVCFGVLHFDGTSSFYDPTELEII